MRGLLIVLCAIVTLAAVLAGGCGLLFTAVVAAAAQNRGDAAGLLMIAAPVLAVTAAVLVANVALITAIAAGRAPRRTIWFLLLAIVDLVVAVILVAAGFAGQGPVRPDKKQPQRPMATLVAKAGTKIRPVEPVIPRARLKISIAAIAPASAPTMLRATPGSPDSHRLAVPTA